MPHFPGSRVALPAPNDPGVPPHLATPPVKFWSSRIPAAGSAAMRLSAAESQPTPGRRVRVERGIYRQPNGKYTVCFMLDGKPRFRTAGYDLALARKQRETLARAASFGVLACAPRLSFAKLAGFWLARLERRVAAGQRRQRTLEAHRYHLHAHLLPALG